MEMQRKSSKKTSMQDEEVDASKADHRSNYSLTDFFNNFDEVTVDIRAINQVYSKNHSNLVSSFVFYSNFRAWAYCIISSLITAIVCFLVEYLASWLLSHRKHNIIEEYYWSSLLVWIMSALLLATISTGICQVYGIEAQGAGVPELKCIITGSRMHQYLEFRVLIAKFFGMITALGAGFVTGRIGPNMHIGAMIFTAVSKFSYFKEMRRDSVLRNQSLIVGGVIGLSCALGTPFTGLVVIVELSEKISSVRTMWILYVGLFFSTVSFKLLEVAANINCINPLKHVWEYPFRELLEFAILGILCGLYGAFFIKFMIYFQRLKGKYAILKTRYTYTWISILIIAFLQYTFNFLRIDDKTLFNDLFGQDILDSKFFTHSNEVLSIFILLALKSFMFFLTITSPIPAGIFAPLMVMGAIVGRMYGHTLKILLGSVNISKYAVAGAAAVAAVVSRFLCLTVLVVEITEDVNIIFLIMITVLFAYGTGNLFTKSFFSSNIELRKLPFCSKLMKHEIYMKTAQDIMLQPQILLFKNSKFNDIYNILTTTENICVGDFIPVVQDANNYKFVGTVKIVNLIRYMKSELKAFSLFSQNLGWMNKLHTMLEIYQFLEEEAINNAKDIIRRTEKIGTQIKAKKMFQMENFKRLFRINDENDDNTQDIELKETMMEYKQNTEFSLEENSSFENFIEKTIDFDDLALKFDSSPLTVNPTLNLCKLHFLFINLGVNTIFIIDQGILLGVINKYYLLSLSQKYSK